MKPRTFATQTETEKTMVNKIQTQQNEIQTGINEIQKFSVILWACIDCGK